MRRDVIITGPFVRPRAVLGPTAGRTDEQASSVRSRQAGKVCTHVGQRRTLRDRARGKSGEAGRKGVVRGEGRPTTRDARQKARPDGATGRLSLSRRMVRHGYHTSGDNDLKVLAVEFCTDLRQKGIVSKRNPLLKVAYNGRSSRQWAATEHRKGRAGVWHFGGRKDTRRARRAASSGRTRARGRGRTHRRWAPTNLRQHGECAACGLRPF